MKEFRKKELVKIETNIDLLINKIIPAKLFKTKNSQENKAAKQNKLKFLFLNNEMGAVHQLLEGKKAG